MVRKYVLWGIALVVIGLLARFGLGGTAGVGLGALAIGMAGLLFGRAAIRYGQAHYGGKR